MTDISYSMEQQQNLLDMTAQNEQPTRQSLWQRVYSTTRTRNFWIILLLLMVIGGIGIAYIPRHKSNDEEGSSGSNRNENYAMDSYNSYKNSQRQSNFNNEDNQRYPMRSSIRRRRKPGRPESMGHMNIYISKSVDDGGRRSFERFRFPVARYNRRHFSLAGPFLTFMPWVPMAADRFTRQTIIYSSSGVYVLPALVNIYGKLYSVAELIASGYASFVSTGAPPTGFIDMRLFFRATPVTGTDVPTISASTGGFVGSMRTNFGSFIDSNDQELSAENDDFNDHERDIDNYRASPYYHSKHHKQQPSNYKLPKTKSPSTEKNTITSTTITETTRVMNPGEVHQTLIIDTFYPYPTSRKPIISVNYSFPGPLLEAYEGDTFVIRVINRLDVPSTIHWHGVRQIGTQDMDGAVGITQCAIAPQHETIYRFKADPAGTLWYHGHLLEQYTDGLYGPLIVHRRNEPNAQFYDSEHILMIADWYNNRAHSDLLPWYLNKNNPGGNEPSPDAIVVNGKFTQSLFIPLSGSDHILFRIINTASFSMYTVSIDGLPLHIIEVDATATSPYTVSTFDINVGQRVSFYINMTELNSNYSSIGAIPTNSLFIRIQAVLSMYPVDILNYIPLYERQRYPYPTFYNPLYLAILSLDSKNSTPAYPANQETPIVPTSMTTKDTNLLDARPLDRNTNGIPNATHFLNLVIAFNLDTNGINRPYLNDVSYTSDANYMHARPDPKKGITSDLYAPLLHQMAEKSKALFIPLPRIENNNQLPIIQSDGNGHYLVPYNAVVDIFLNNTDGGEHPFHLHSYHFWIIATSDYPEAENLYAENYIQRDTVSIPANGWAKIRFLADNPGAWFFHCHIEWHMSAGLAMSFLVSPEQLLADGYTITDNQKQLCRALRAFNKKNGTNLV